MYFRCSQRDTSEVRGTPETTYDIEIVLESTLTSFFQQFAGFMFARKISSTPFPFPFAQSIELFVTFFSLSVGVIFASWLDGIVPVIFFSFVTSWCYLTLNEVCRMLEEPFGGDANDLPLAVLQHEFNMRIVRSRFADSTVDQWEKKTAIE